MASFGEKVYERVIAINNNGVIANCYSPASIEAEFAGMTVAQAVKACLAIDKHDRDLHDEAMAESGEYVKTTYGEWVLAGQEERVEENKCGWLCEGYPPDAGEDWYPDSPSDLIYACQAVAHEAPWGWYCDAGHEWRRDEEFFDEDEQKAMGIWGRF